MKQSPRRAVSCSFRIPCRTAALTMIKQFAQSNCTAALTLIKQFAQHNCTAALTLIKQFAQHNRTAALTLINLLNKAVIENIELLKTGFQQSNISNNLILRTSERRAHRKLVTLIALSILFFFSSVLLINSLNPSQHY